MKNLLIIAVVGTFLLSACSMAGSLKSKQAVKGAIETHLRGNSNLSLQNFNTEIEQVTFKDDTADALAKFVSKADERTSVEVRYKLKLEDRHWAVVSSAPAGGQGMDIHGGENEGAPASSQPPAQSPSPEASH